MDDRDTKKKVGGAIEYSSRGWTLIKVTLTAPMLLIPIAELLFRFTQHGWKAAVVTLVIEGGGYASYLILSKKDKDK